MNIPDCQSPYVTVLMPVFNCQAFLSDAVKSILNQSFSNFEFLIINDGSTDDSGQILDSIAALDQRVRVIHQENQRLVATLNKGLSLAKGKYIVRMDGDDISDPERIGKQVAYMDAHLNIGVSGTWVGIIGTNEIWRYPCTHSAIHCGLLFNSSLAHPSVIMRRSFLVENSIQYDRAYERCEDYELWSRIATMTRLANLPEPLLYHRLHPSQVGEMYKEIQVDAADRIRLGLLRRLDISDQEPGLEIHLALSKWHLSTEREFYLRAEAWLIKLVKKNFQKRIYSPTALGIKIGEYWGGVYTHAKKLGIMQRSDFWQSPLVACFWLKRINDLFFSRKQY